MDQLTKTNTALSAHPAAELFPVLSDKELAALADDIRENGQTMPVVVWDDRNVVVDGRNRLAACESLGIEPRIEWRAFADDAAVARFVVSANVHRRHLSESQRATIGARLKADFFGPVAKERSQIGRVNGGRIRHGSFPANLPPSRDAREEAAEAVNVSPRLIDAACDVLERGAPEVKAAVDADDLAVTAAASMLDLNHNEQRAILERVKSGKARSVRVALAELAEERAQSAQDGQRSEGVVAANASNLKGASRLNRKHPFWGLIANAEYATCTWNSLVDDSFFSMAKFANSTAEQRKELIAALKSEIRAANRFITWLEKQAGRTKSS
jgi:hypothetical protein